jgi:oligopeptidase B
MTLAPVRHLVALIFVSSLSLSLPAAEPPRADTRPHPLTAHGIKWIDDYFWLREREDPAVKAYLEAENAWLESVMAPLKELRATLVAEMKARIIEEDTSVPYRKGAWLYYGRDVAGKDHALICRKPWHSDKAADLLAPAGPGEEVILLDLNERAGGDEAFSFGGGAVSPDGRLYAWKENHDGTDLYTLRIRDLSGGRILPDAIEGTMFDEAPVWGLDNRTLYYTLGDETDRPWRVLRHVLGDDAGKDALILEETDVRFSVSIDGTKSGRFLLITSSSKDTNEVSRIPLGEPGALPSVFFPRKDGIRTFYTDRGDEWFILSNEGAVNGRVFRAPLADPARGNWVEVLPGDEAIAYESVDAFATRVVLGARRGGVPGFLLLDPGKGTTKWVASPTEGGWVGGDPTPEYTATAQRFSYGTMLKPHTVAEADLETGEVRLLKEKSPPRGYDSARYRVERTFATASDGTRIPVWLLLRTDHPRDGGGGILLDGYGAYGIASDPWFDSNVFSLVDRGIGYAVAQVRGGGEFGRPWYEAGKLARKETTFTDYIACAEHLVAEGYASPKTLCGTGASAGGLLAGAVLNRRPDLFGAFIANVPFVDVLNTMLDAGLPLTTGEYDEWGDPASSREVFDRLRAYSPYDNVRSQAYPPLLVLAGWNDNRVPYWEAAKWVARLRVHNTGATPPLLHTAFETGHGGASGRYGELEEVALQYAFVLRSLGKVSSTE